MSQPDAYTCPPASIASGSGKAALSLDQSIAAMLSDQIGCHIEVIKDNDFGDDAFFQQLRSQPSKVHLRDSNKQMSDNQITTTQLAIALPQGSVASWTCDRDQAERVGKHAQAVLQLAIAKNENRQLLSEVDSLTNQVMQDFEELSLIRTLASGLELPQTADEVDEFVISSLQPLASGVGAQTMAAVLVDGEQKRRPLWTDAVLLDDQSLWDLVEDLRSDAAIQPVVRNHDLIRSKDGNGVVKELTMVECSSEGRLHGWVIACNRITDETEDLPWAQLGFTTVQASLMETVTNQLASQLNNIRLLRQKEELFTDVIRALVNAVEARDPYTCGHSERVACFAKCLASKVGFSVAECERIYLTGLLHDVGKIAIPDGVLQKPAALNDEERAIIETHTDSGWRILQELDALQDILPGVLYHHERFNGEGYPDKLVGENIPIDGRILAVCDAFDAMTSDRPYRTGMSIDRALQILVGGAGEFWDPHLIEIFKSNIDEIDQIRMDHRPRTPVARPTPVDGKPVIGVPGVSVDCINDSVAPPTSS
ncbi:HD-GYP domain-containing protein [Stieleria sp. JC731]|uniref:HD-GYP domain-containing protein n=1 Tax=Pirellulaceae TaxID=2691357 RepID=UPI001E29A88E|nr:HD-GYP domain-containing protein [Stieleria sp. JC731]MCC9600043.1 HD-GYP domain-containing protein [Stieleria sp. JC731]